MKMKLNAPTETAVLLPWQQIARYRSRRRTLFTSELAGPRIVLRGERGYLRSLRAAEMAAWETASNKSFRTNPAPAQPAAALRDSR